MSDNLAQCGAGFHEQMSSLWPFLNTDLPPDVFKVSQQHQTSGLIQMHVNGTNGTAEDAIDRHTQCRCFSVHRTPSPDCEVRMPKQIESIHRVLWNRCPIAFEPLRPCVH